ncbi:MAG: AAA family ATPase [Candidatus Poseidoniaceae archaeon]|nr:AAA family ATPase [Candidatus Poseidoniaceae archaeon]
MSKDKDESETNKFIEAQENFQDQKASDEMDGEFDESLSEEFFKKISLTDGLVDEKLEIGSSRWKISQFDNDINEKIVLLQEKIDRIETLIEINSPGGHTSIRDASKVESLSKEAKLEIDRISDLLTSKGSNLFFNRAIEEFLSFTNSEYHGIEELDLEVIGDSLYSLVMRLESVSLDVNDSTREKHLPDDNLFLRTILFSLSNYLILLNASILSFRIIKERGDDKSLHGNYIYKINEAMKYADIDTNGAVFSQFIQLPNLISEIKFSLNEEDSEELKPIRDVIVEALNVMGKVISNIDINFEGYRPKLSDVNSHIPTSRLNPQHTSGNYGMWPDKVKQYTDLEFYDRENWIGKYHHSETTSGASGYYPILYRDFIDFIQSLGYRHLKVTHHEGEKRVQPKLSPFTWKGEVRKFRGPVTIYFYNEKCPILGKESRIIINSHIGQRSGTITCEAGLYLMENKGEFDDREDGFTDGVEYESVLRQRTESMIREIFEQFEDYQKQFGLLKNAKFDANYRELNSKGRTFDEMVLEKIKKELLDDNIFTIIENYESLHERGVQTNRGIILAGPPGVGKSMTIDSIISRADCTVIYADFISLHKRMEEIFQIARKYSPTILILEDIDALGITAQRDTVNAGGGMSTLLNCMDGIESNDGVITVATSNHPEHLDWALVNRPGRFDIRIDYFYPDNKVLEEILKIKLMPHSCSKDLDVKVIAKEMPFGFTGSHIQDIVNQANYIVSKNKSKNDITQKSLQIAFERTLYNFNKFLEERKMSSKDLSRNDKSKARDDNPLWD